MALLNSYQGWSPAEAQGEPSFGVRRVSLRKFGYTECEDIIRCGWIH